MELPASATFPTMGPPAKSGIELSQKRQYHVGRRGALVLSFCIVVFGAVALLMGLPGADGDSCGTYNVITRLADKLTYTLSRSPGQPFLDYCNFIAWSVGGDVAVHVWYVLLSALGVMSLYFLAVEVNGSCPTVAALTLALHPLFLSHVGGLGDFAVSLSFLLTALLLSVRRWPIAAGLSLALAVGCRLEFCVYVLPVTVLALSAQRGHGASWRKSSLGALLVGSVAGLASIAFYAPLFCYWGWHLLDNLPWQGLRYHLPAFFYRLFVSLGISFWVVAGLTARQLFIRRKVTGSVVDRFSGIDLGVCLLTGLGLITLFRMPTKPEIALPILVGAILILQRWTTRAWAIALLASSILVGVVGISPYQPEDSRYAWAVRRGLYAEGVLSADKNRLTMRAIERFLASRQSATVLVAVCSWTEAQKNDSDLERIQDYRGVTGLTAFTFRQLGRDRVVVHFQEKDLGMLLNAIAKERPGSRPSVYYETSLEGMVLRWSRVDLAKFGTGIVLQRSPLADLWQTAGRENATLRVPRGAPKTGQ